jgi:hypothetical protein
MRQVRRLLQRWKVRFYKEKTQRGIDMLRLGGHRPPLQKGNTATEYYCLNRGGRESRMGTSANLWQLILGIDR